MWQIATNSPNELKVGSMATKQERGTKRTCQNSECGARFYDLNIKPIVCSVCGTEYRIASSPSASNAPPPEPKTPRKAKKEEFATAESSDDETEEDEELADVETDDSVDDDDDDSGPFLEEEEEDGGDVSNIIGGPVKEGEEET
jgi:uncharacterized protein (TIGR02300 family)